MKHVVIPSVNIYVVEDGKVLLSRRANTGWMDGKLCAPGGHVEAGETPRQAMVREIHEELGADVAIEDLELFCVAARNSEPQEYVAYEFIIRDKHYDFTNQEPDKCSELVWIPLDNLGYDIIPDFKEIIQRGLIKNEVYLELGYDMTDSSQLL